MYALMGAYRKEGMEWVDQLCSAITENVTYACEFIKNNLSGIEVTPPEGTNMLFLDCGKWCKDNGRDVSALIKAGRDVGVAWQDGRPFHGENHIRMNLALPHERVREALDRLKKYVFGE
jgi:cystathionine beta-lyase